MQPRINPNVVDHYPGNVDSHIALNSTIKVKFSKNLNSDSINENTFMVIEQGTGNINGQLKYERSTKTIFFTPEQLKADTKYQVVVVGDLNSNDPEHTILDALDKPLETNYTFSFTTTDIAQVKSPEIINPNHQTIINELEFSWSEIDNADKYKVLISKDKLFDKSDYEEVVSGTSLSLNDLELNNEYFMKIKALSEGIESDWSNVHSFYYEVTAANEKDSSNQDSSFVFNAKVKLVNILEEINVSSNLNEIVFELNEAVALEDIDISLIGKSINDIPYIKSDGEKNGTLEILEQKEGYTKIRYVI